MRNFVSQSVQNMPSSGIRRYFDIAATMEDVITLGIGEPNFATPQHIMQKHRIAPARRNRLYLQFRHH